MKFIPLGLICLCAIVNVSHAKTIYKSIDSNGTIVFTDKPNKNIKQEIINLDIDNNSEQQSKLKIFKAQLQKNQSSAQYQQEKIDAASKKLKQAEMQLNLMKKRDQEAYAKCLERKALLRAKNIPDTYYVCRHASMRPYQQAIIEASRDLNRLKKACMTCTITQLPG